MQKYNEIVNEVGDLPPMPIVAVKVMELLQDPDTSINQLATTISLDAAVSARMLKIANSSIYGVSRQITTLQNALVLLGERTVRSLVLASSMSSVNKSYGLLEKMLWEESVGCALASRYLSTKLKVSKPDEAFLAGLFSNLGKILRNNNEPDRYRELVEAVYNGAGDYSTLELEVFSAPYTEVGAAVLHSWKIAPLLVDSVCCQNHIDQAESSEVMDLSSVVNLASHLCFKLGIGHRESHEEFDLSLIESAKKLMISSASLDEIAVEFQDVFDENRDSFMS